MNNEEETNAAIAALAADVANAKGFPTAEVSVANLTLALEYIAALEGVDPDE